MMRLHCMFPCNLRCTLNLSPPSPTTLRLHLFIVCLSEWIRYVQLWMWCYEVREEIREQLGGGELTLSFHHMDPQDRIWVSRLGSQPLYPLSHHISPASN